MISSGTPRIGIGIPNADSVPSEYTERAHGVGPSSSSSSSSTRLGPGSSTSTPTSIAGTGPPPDPLPLPLIRLPGRIDPLDPNTSAIPVSSSSSPTSNTKTTTTSAHPLKPLTSLRWPAAPDETVFLDPLSADQVRPLRLGWVGAGAEAAGHGVGAGAGARVEAGAEGYSALAMSPELRRLFGPAPGVVPASTSTSDAGTVPASTSTPTTKNTSTSTSTTTTTGKHKHKHNHKTTGTTKDTTTTTATKNALLATGPDLRTTLRHLRSYPRYARKAHLARLLGFEGDLAVDDLGGRPHGHSAGRGKTIKVDKVPEGGWYLPAFEVENKAPGRSSASASSSSSYYIGEEETLAFRRFAECVRTVVGDQGQGQGQTRGGDFEWEV